MADKSLDRIISCLARLSEIADNLKTLNIDFLSGQITAERLHIVLDQREVSYQEMSDIENELRVIFAKSDSSKMPGLGEITEFFGKKYPEAANARDKLRKTIEELLESDEQVRLRLEQEKTDLASQIKATKKGSNLLKGYAQSDPTGSCFIDRIK